MKPSNDNSDLKLTNKAHSLSLRELSDGTFALSCFRLGSDGSPDLDGGEVFVTQIDHGAEWMLPIRKRAVNQFNSWAALMSCPASLCDQTIDAVSHAIAELGSCLHREVPNRAESVRFWLNQLEVISLKRRDARREALIASVTERARQTLARRFEGLEAKIATEAEGRTARGLR